MSDMSTWIRDGIAKTEAETKNIKALADKATAETAQIVAQTQAQLALAPIEEEKGERALLTLKAQQDHELDRLRVVFRFASLIAAIVGATVAAVLR